MCGRYTHVLRWRELHDLLEFGILPKSWPAELRPSFNVAPTQVAPIVRLDDEGRRVPALAKWGLVPSWSADEKMAARTINARSETVATSPAFRSAFKARRCIVPASSFYEWQAVEGSKTKQPWSIQRADGAPLLFAGLWERWSKGDTPLDSFTICTTRANAMMAEIHDRTPCVVEPEQVGAWMNGDAEQAKALMVPAADGVLARHRVAAAVGNVRNNDPSLIERVD